MTNLDTLAVRYRAAFERTKQGRAEWIDGTMELAAVVLEARKAMPANADFGNWLTRNGFDYMAPNDRTALIGFATHPEEMRKILERTGRFSWRLIWEQEAPKEWKQGRLSSVAKTASKMTADPKKKAAIRRAAIAERNAEVRQKHKEFVSNLTPLKGLTPEEIGEPDLTPRELHDKYGHVRLHTKTQVEEMASRDRITDWVKLVSDARKLAVVEVPEDIFVWAESPRKRQKLDRWLDELEKIAGIVAHIRSRLSGAPVEVRRTA